MLLKRKQRTNEDITKKDAKVKTLNQTDGNAERAIDYQIGSEMNINI